MHISAQEGVYTHLITQILHRFAHFLIGLFHRCQRFICRLIIFAVHVHVSHESIHLVGIFRIGIFAQELLESSNTLTQCRTLQIGNLHIVVHGFLAQLRIDIESYSGGICQLSILFITYAQITMSQMQVTAFRNGIFLFFDGFELLNCLLIFSHFIVGNTQQINIITERFSL